MKRQIEPGRIYAAVTAIHFHDSWNPLTASFEGDIAILKLSGAVATNEFIRPVCIANIQTSVSREGTVVGWGVHDDSEVPSNFPRKIQIPILSDRDCFTRNPGLLKIFSDDLFCAGKVGAAVCKGDSGSGFYVENYGRFFLRGIVSSSIVTSCSQSNSALYSDILKNMDFIRKVSFMFPFKLLSVIFFSRNKHSDSEFIFFNKFTAVTGGITTSTAVQVQREVTRAPFILYNVEATCKR